MAIKGEGLTRAQYEDLVLQLLAQIGLPMTRDHGDHGPDYVCRFVDDANRWEYLAAVYADRYDDAAWLDGGRDVEPRMLLTCDGRTVYDLAANGATAFLLADDTIVLLKPGVATRHVASGPIRARVPIDSGMILAGSYAQRYATQSEREEAALLLTWPRVWWDLQLGITIVDREYLAAYTGNPNWVDPSHRHGRACTSYLDYSARDPDEKHYDPDWVEPPPCDLCQRLAHPYPLDSGGHWWEHANT